MPPTAEMRFTVDSSHPAWRKVAPSSARIDGSAGGTLPTWNAATIPAATRRPISPQGVRRIIGSVLNPSGDRAVDDEVGATYERSGRAGQEGDAGGDLLRRANAAHRVFRKGLLVALGVGLVLPAPGIAFLVDRARGHHVHPYAFGRQIDRQRFDERHERRLHRAIRSYRAGPRLVQRYGADHGAGGAVTALHKMRHDVAHRFDSGNDVDVDGLAPAGGRIVGAQRAHVGDEMVDAALGCKSVDPLLEGGIVRHVERRARDAALLALPFLLTLGYQFGITRAEADHCAFGQERIDDRTADALGAAGD